MKACKKLILTYLDKYKELNFDVLSIELRVPAASLIKLAEELLQGRYIECENREWKLTASGKREVFSSWNTYTATGGEEEKSNFQWEEVYVPENFLKKL